MASLFSRPKYPEPEPPATMPDESDPASRRVKRKTERRLRTQSSTRQNRLAPVPGTIGREYSRSTLGAN